MLVPELFGPIRGGGAMAELAILKLLSDCILDGTVDGTLS